MKTVQMTVEIRTGLPNYSSRTTSATVVADEGESLDIKTVTKQLAGEIKEAWSSNGSKKPVKAQKPTNTIIDDILG